MWYRFEMLRRMCYHICLRVAAFRKVSNVLPHQYFGLNVTVWQRLEMLYIFTHFFCVECVRVALSRNVIFLPLHYFRLNVIVWQRLEMLHFLLNFFGG